MLKEKVDDKVNKILKYRHLILSILIYVLYTFGNFNQSSAIITIACVLSSALCLFSSTINSFYFLVGFATFESISKVAGINVYFVFLLIISTKLVIANFKKRIWNLRYINIFILLVSIVIINDMPSASLGELIILININLYLYLFTQVEEIQHYNPINTILYFTASYLLVIIQTIMSYGSFTQFITYMTGSDIVLSLIHI